MPKNRIALNVLEAVTRKVNIHRALEAGDIPLVVFTGSNVGLREKVEELKNLKKNMFALAFSSMASKILDTDFIIDELYPVAVYREEDISRLGDILEKYPYLIGPNITVNTLSKVALGIIDSFIPALIWTYLYKGKKVYLDFQSTKGYMASPINNNAMEGIIDGHINTIKSMGAIEIKQGSYSNIFTYEEEDVKKEVVKDNYSAKKIITAKDLQDMPKGEHITLPKGTIVTPLAKDTAKLMGIVLEIEE